MRSSEPDEETSEAPFQAPVYVDEATRRRRLIPPLILAVPLASPAKARAFVEWIKLHLPLVLLFAIPMLFGSEFFGLAWEAHLGDEVSPPIARPNP